MNTSGVFSRKCRRKLQIIEGAFKWDNKNTENKTKKAMNTYFSVVSSGMSATGVFSRKCRRKLQIIEGAFWGLILLKWLARPASKSSCSTNTSSSDELLLNKSGLDIAFSYSHTTHSAKNHGIPVAVTSSLFAPS